MAALDVEQLFASSTVNMYEPGPRENVPVPVYGGVPPEAVTGRTKVTVRFQATGGNEIAAVCGIRMIRADAER